MSQKGVSPGWIVMNIIVGYICGTFMHKAAEKGVRVLAVDCRITPDSMIPEDPVPVDLYYKSSM